MICYDYPLNERVRTLLRLEDLYNKIRFFAAEQNAHAHHSAVVTLFELLDVVSRTDLKSDLLQELERQKTILESLRHHPEISQEALDKILTDIGKTTGSLYDAVGKAGQHLRDNEWLMSIRQRTGIPGGVCEFDLPSYHYWLSGGNDQRQQDIRAWLSPMLPIYDGIRIVLQLLRDNGKTNHQTAGQGNFQQMLSGKVFQMLRIFVEKNLPYFPEVSANKYAINIRFVVWSGDHKPVGCESNVEFDLTLCSL